MRVSTVACALPQPRAGVPLVSTLSGGWARRGAKSIRAPGCRLAMARSAAVQRWRRVGVGERARTARVVAGEYGFHVPSDSFGGLSPEAKAAQQLNNMFTFVAVRVVLAQMEGSGRGDLGSYAGSDYDVLRDHLLQEPMKDGDAWCKALLLKNKALAMRVLEVRKAYVASEFEWDNCRRLAVEHMANANVVLMRESMEEALAASFDAVPDEEEGPGGGAAR